MSPRPPLPVPAAQSMSARARTVAVTVALLALLALPAAAGAAGAAGAAAPSGHWTFDESSGTTAADSSGGGHPLTLQAGAGWGAGTVGPSALAVNGKGQYAQSSGPVIDTTSSFTVSAWVDLTNTDGYQTFVSQDGFNVSGFYLQLRGDTHQFAFTRLAYDSTKALGTIASATGVVPQPDEWYHLAGVYDARRQTISLYVNGRLAQTQPFVPDWSAGGPLAVGRGLFGASRVDFTSGRIDDVRTYASALPAGAIAALAGPGRLSVDAAQPGPAINPTQFGEFLEEINHSGDGGLYDELIQNRDLKEVAGDPVAYSAVGDRNAAIALDRSVPLNSDNAVSLKLSVPAGTGRAGVANSGWWGIPVRPATTYRVSFFARTNGAAGPVNAALVSNSGHVWAASTVTGVGGGWQKYTTTLRTPAGIPASEENRFVLTVPEGASPSTVWFGFISVFAPTYDGAANGFRVDLMNKLAALDPGYLRIPGGNYLEGDTVATRFNWEATVGPVQNRPGHEDSAWGYWSQDGLGLLEYLELAQQLHAQPVLAVWAGYTLTGTVVPQSELAPYVHSALDEIQYAIGSTSTPYGHQRALDGHPAPFDLKMVEIGNEDFFDTSGSYNTYRYPAFYDAIHAAYPQLKLVATTPVTSRPTDVVDEHYYNDDPAYFAQNAHLFDAMTRTGPKVIVGEYATTNGTPTGTLANALGEAAFLTGTERNADLVLGASYAPLLVNVNAPSWPTNLIGYDALHSYGSPSYWAQQMLGAGHGTRVIGSQVTAGPGTLFQVASESAGHTYVVVVNDGPAAAPTQVQLAGLGGGASGGTATVLSGTPGAMNSLAHPRAVTPRTRRLGPLGPTFAYRFAPRSVTVLDLTTPAARPAAVRKQARRPGARLRFTMSAGDRRLPHRGRRLRAVAHPRPRRHDG
jgi:alpha-L-arabinofuranosidase